MAKKKNPHIRRSLDEFIGEQRAKDPEFRAEFDRLQLARKVKGLREKKKMSQLRLAALAGTKQPNIARLESGKVIPKLDKRFTDGFLLTTSYTLGRSINSWQGTTNGGIPTPANIALSRGRAEYDRTHNYTQSFVYLFPFGRDGRWVKSGPASWIIVDAP